jgi:hypothetical protein
MRSVTPPTVICLPALRFGSGDWIAGVAGRSRGTRTWVVRWGMPRDLWFWSPWLCEGRLGRTKSRRSLGRPIQRHAPQGRLKSSSKIRSREEESKGLSMEPFQRSGHRGHAALPVGRHRHTLSMPRAFAAFRSGVLEPTPAKRFIRDECFSLQGQGRHAMGTRYDEREGVCPWHLLIGLNVPPSKVSLAACAAHGYSRIPVCRSRPSLKMRKPDHPLRRSWNSFAYPASQSARFWNLQCAAFKPCPYQLDPRQQMRILFDHGTPSGIANALSGHEVTEAIDREWDRI